MDCDALRARNDGLKWTPNSHDFIVLRGDKDFVIYFLPALLTLFF